MKKIISLLLILAAFLSFTAAYAENNVTVNLCGKVLEFDVQPTIINDRTMVPMRKIFEELGANVEWVGESKMIFATKGAKCILLQIGQPAMAIKDFMTDEEIIIRLDTAPVIVDDRTLVPLRAVSEALDMNVDWDGETYTVYITEKTPAPVAG